MVYRPPCITRPSRSLYAESIGGLGLKFKHRVTSWIDAICPNLVGGVKTKLFPDPVLRKLHQNALLPHVDHKPVVKLFGGPACNWLFVSITGDLLFGLCDLGLGEAELGYVSKTELESLRFPPFNLPVERDRFFTPIAPLSVYAAKASAARRIVEHWD